MCDIPYITKVRQSELLPELSQEDTWRIFELDLEYGKFTLQKKQCVEFFAKIETIAQEDRKREIEYYKNQV